MTIEEKIAGLKAKIEALHKEIDDLAGESPPGHLQCFYDDIEDALDEIDQLNAAHQGQD